MYTCEGNEVTPESHIRHLENYSQDLLNMAAPYLHRSKQLSATEEYEQILSLLGDVKRHR